MAVRIHNALLSILVGVILPFLSGSLFAQGQTLDAAIVEQRVDNVSQTGFNLGQSLWGKFNLYVTNMNTYDIHIWYRIRVYDAGGAPITSTGYMDKTVMPTTNLPDEFTDEITIDSGETDGYAIWVVMEWGLTTNGVRQPGGQEQMLFLED